MMKTTVMVRAASALAAAAVVSLAAIGCSDFTGQGSLSLQIEFRFVETTPDSGYVLLDAFTQQGIGSSSVDCTGFIQASAPTALRDSTFVAKELQERVVTEMCVATAEGFTTVEGGAATTIPALTP